MERRLACSRRSDSGERCEVKKEREKIKPREEELPSPPPLFIAFFTSHRSPLSERLEQAKRRQAEQEIQFVVAKNFVELVSKGKRFCLYSFIS